MKVKTSFGTVTSLNNGKKQYMFQQYPLQPFIVDQCYQLIRIKGSGSFGTVVQARNLITNKQVAIKRIKNIFQTQHNAKRILRQIKIQKFLKHPYIMQLTQILSIQNQQSFNQIYLCMDYMDYTLQDFIYSSKITQQWIRSVMHRILSAIYYMHSANIYHRDLKPNNILISSNSSKVKIIDLNLATKGQYKKNLTRVVQTQPYRAPQIYIFNTKQYTSAIDMWSIGCILAQILGKNVLFDGPDDNKRINQMIAFLGKPKIEDFYLCSENERQIIQEIFSKFQQCQRIKWKVLYPHASDEVLDLLDKLLVYNPSQRLTAEQALKHNFFKKYAQRPLKRQLNKFDFKFDELLTQVGSIRKQIYRQIMGQKKQQISSEPQKKIKLDKLQ